MHEYKSPIKASELIAKIKEGVEAEIVDADGVCERLRCIDISYENCNPVDGLIAHCYWPEDSATCGLDFGSYEVEVEGVVFRAQYYGPDCGHGEFDVEGRDIEWDDNEEGYEIEWSDIIDALEEHCSFPEYNPEGCELDVDDLSEKEVYDALCDGDGPQFFARDEEGELFCFDNEEDITEGFVKVDRDEALRAIAAGDYSIEKM